MPGLDTNYLWLSVAYIRSRTPQAHPCLLESPIRSSLHELPWAWALELKDPFGWTCRARYRLLAARAFGRLLFWHW